MNFWIIRFFGFLVLALSFAACSDDGQVKTKLQYVPDMADAPTVKPHEDYLDPPTGSVPLFSIIYPDTPQDAEKVLKNPLGENVSDNTLEKGKFLFDIYCKVCHGADGRGQGTLGAAYPAPPNISGEPYTNYKDGFFFHRITFGSFVKQGDSWISAGLMPAYGDKTDPNERWEIVAYVRKLQDNAKVESENK